MMNGKAYACGAGTIINAIALWKGSAFGIDLKTTAEVALNDGKMVKGIIEGGGNPELIERCVKLTLDHFGRKYGAEITTTSEVPVASGLKSSSAAANAAVLATLDALGETMDPIETVRLGVRAAIDSRVTITGAFDDACASFFGGIVVTDNRSNELVKRIEKDSQVLILVPNKKVYSSSTNVTNSRLIAPWVGMAYDLALNGEYEKAMTLNGLLYCAALGFSPEPIISALHADIEGATLSGTGPSYVAIGPGEKLNKLEKTWSRFDGRVIRTVINNKGAGICQH